MTDEEEALVPAVPGRARARDLAVAAPQVTRVEQ